MSTLGVTHVMLQAGVYLFDFGTGKHSLVKSAERFFQVDSVLGTDLVLGAGLSQGTGTLVFLLKVKFYQMVNGQLHMLNGRKGGCMRGIKVSDLGEGFGNADLKFENGIEDSDGEDSVGNLIVDFDGVRKEDAWVSGKKGGGCVNGVGGKLNLRRSIIKGGDVVTFWDYFFRTKTLRYRGFGGKDFYGISDLWLYCG